MDWDCWINLGRCDDFEWRRSFSSDALAFSSSDFQACSGFGSRFFSDMLSRILDDVDTRRWYDCCGRIFDAQICWCRWLVRCGYFNVYWSNVFIDDGRRRIWVVNESFLGWDCWVRF